jgi:alpha-ribazole phosphatase
VTTPHMLYLMRHGAPAVEGLLLGRTDSPATTNGIAACASRAHGLDIARFVSSDLLRARQCAAAVAEPRGLAVESDPRWRELDFGDWDGLAPLSVDSAALARFHDDPDAAPPPNGEQWSALCDRIAQALAALPPQPTLVVTHGGAIRAALTVACGFDQRQMWAFALPYAALITLKVWSGDTPTVQIVGLAT